MFHPESIRPQAGEVAQKPRLAQHLIGHTMRPAAQNAATREAITVTATAVADPHCHRKLSRGACPPLDTMQHLRKEQARLVRHAPAAATMAPNNRASTRTMEFQRS